MNGELIVGAWSNLPAEIEPQVIEPEDALSERVSDTENPAEWLINAFGGGASKAGVRVNAATALSSSSLYQAITLMAEQLALTNVDVYDMLRDGTKEKVDPHPISNIFNPHYGAGNEEMTPNDVRITLHANTFLHGNGIGVIDWRAGVPVGVYPIEPHRVFAQRLPPDPDLQEVGLAHQLIYTITSAHGTTLTLFAPEVIHTKMFGNGIWGYSPLNLFRDLIGNGLAMEDFQGHNFRNGAKPSGLLKHNPVEGIKRKLTDEAKANLRREWSHYQSGLTNTGRVAILTDGVDFVPLSVSADEAAMIPSLKYFREQVASVYKIPPHKMGALDNSSVRANLDSQERAWIQDCLKPHAATFSQEVRRKMCSVRDRERRRCIVLLDFKHLERADVQTQFEAANKVWVSGLATRDEARDMIGLPPIGGDTGGELLRPVNTHNDQVAQELDAIEVQQKQQELDQSKEGGGDDDMALVEAIQKVYLGVGTVLTADEARDILNTEHGASLVEDFEPEAPPPNPFDGAGDDDDGAGDGGGDIFEEQLRVAEHAMLERQVKERKYVIRNRKNKAGAKFNSWVDEFYDDYAQEFELALSPLKAYSNGDVAAAVAEYIDNTKCLLAECGKLDEETASEVFSPVRVKQLIGALKDGTQKRLQGQA